MLQTARKLVSSKIELTQKWQKVPFYDIHETNVSNSGITSKRK